MKRTLLLGTAWTASAAAAVGLGFLAVSLVDASASPGTVPLAAASSAPSSDDPAASPSASTATTAAATKATVAGTVSATCTTGTPRVSGAPATGWWIDDSDDADPGQVEFRDGSRKLEVSVTCVDGSPHFVVEGPRADDSGGGNDDAVSPAPATTDAPDDSDGRVGGGHGSDDPVGDDSGSGSDDSGSDDSGGHGGGGSGGHGSDD
jgi:hypothetical protein